MTHTRTTFRVVLTIAALIAAVLVPSVAQPLRADALSAADWDPGYIISDENFYNGRRCPRPRSSGSSRPGVAAARRQPSCLAVHRTDTSDAECRGPGRLLGVRRRVDAARRSSSRSTGLRNEPQGDPRDVAEGTEPHHGPWPRTRHCGGHGLRLSRHRRRATRPTTGSSTSSSTPPASSGSTEYPERRSAWGHVRSGTTRTPAADRAVLMRNQATAALYYYTPYPPNAAALANLCGTGDGCSAYGNRNFWVFYNTWFGPTTASPNPFGNIELVTAQPGKFASSAGRSTRTRVLRSTSTCMWVRRGRSPRRTAIVPMSAPPIREPDRPTDST